MASTISISRPESIEEDHKSVKISKVEVAASYNWLDEFTPAILVPGIPSVWDPPKFHPALKPDSGPRFIDQNTDRNPSLPLEALIRAVQTLQPAFEFAEIHVVTDRRPMRRLFGFVNGEPHTFKFGVTIIGDTALLTRIENQTRENDSNEFHGYRDAFEEAYTKVAAFAKGSTSHHRILHYEFGGLKFLVRSCIDAYLKDHAQALMPAESQPNQIDPEPLASWVKALSLDEPARPNSSSPFNRLVVIQRGRNIPHGATLELTTRSKNSRFPFNMEQKMPDLWLSQTPHFIMAYHENVGHPKSNPRRSRFKDIIVEPMREKLVEWEAGNMETLQKLVSVLEKVVEAVKQFQAPCVVSFDGEEAVSLTISKAEGGHLPSLPKELQALFVPAQAKADDSIA